MVVQKKIIFFFFQAEDGIRDIGVTGVQTCALPISIARGAAVALSMQTAWKYSLALQGQIIFWDGIALKDRPPKQYSQLAGN